MNYRKILKYTIGLPILVLISIGGICVLIIEYIISSDNMYFKSFKDDLISFWRE